MTAKKTDKKTNDAPKSKKVKVVAERYIYSTLSTDMNYNTPMGKIFIAGKANITNTNLIMPTGAVTPVSEAQLDALLANHVFQLHRDNGFMNVQSVEHEVDDVTADMTPKDDSAPATEDDVKAEAEKTGTVVPEVQ